MHSRRAHHAVCDGSAVAQALGTIGGLPSPRRRKGRNITMSESHWPLVTAAVHQLGAFVEEASAHHMRFRVDAVSIDLRPEPQLGPVDGLQALAELGEVAQPLRES